MRSLLLVPMDDPAGVDAAFASGADALVLDLAAGAREAGTRDRARRSARDVLRSARLGTPGPLLYLRLADLQDDGFDLDLAATMVGEPDGVVLAGSRSGADVQHLGVKLAVHEADFGLADGETGIIADAGARARALFTLGTYGDSSPRLVGLTWHAADLAADLGNPHTGDDLLGFAPFDTVRHLTLFAARAAEVAAIDTASLALTPDTLLRECRAARQQGFNAKFAASAIEIETINAVFGHED